MRLIRSVELDAANQQIPNPKTYKPSVACILTIWIKNKTITLEISFFFVVVDPGTPNLNI